MSLRKRCNCPRAPRCGCFWHYDFYTNHRRYRGSTETADKHRARNIFARERARILERRHGISRQPDITFRTFATTYLRDHAEVHKRSVARDREIIKVLNRAFGSLMLHQVTRHRIEQFKRERLTGRWRAYQQKVAASSRSSQPR